MCLNQSLVNGGMYVCVNFFEFYENCMCDICIQERGMMMFGFYMFDLFLYYLFSVFVKNVFNYFLMFFLLGVILVVKVRSEDDLFFEFGVNILEVYDYMLRQLIIINYFRELFLCYRLFVYEVFFFEINIIVEFMGQECFYFCV